MRMWRMYLSVRLGAGLERDHFVEVDGDGLTSRGRCGFLRGFDIRRLPGAGGSSAGLRRDQARA